jgi:hypothetical protein
MFKRGESVMTSKSKDVSGSNEWSEAAMDTASFLFSNALGRVLECSARNQPSNIADGAFAVAKALDRIADAMEAANKR